MDIDEYQKQALISVAITQRGTAALSHRTLGLTGEAGILANQVKKAIRDKNSELDEEDIAVIKKRLGDVLYYAATLAEYIQIPLSEIAKSNLAQAEKFQSTRKTK